MDYVGAFAGQQAMTVGTNRSTTLFREACTALPGPLLIADVAAGKGVTACALAAGLEARVLAFDLMRAFVVAAGAAVQERGLAARVGAIVAEGTQLPLPDGACDAASCLGAPSILGLPGSLHELSRITRPGGIVAVSDAFLRDGAPSDLPTEMAELPALPGYLQMLRVAGLRPLSQHAHLLEDWIAYLAPLRSTADRVEREGEAGLAAEIRGMVEAERAAAESALDYVTIIARRE
ncbi:MAG: Ubiquinone/menaquinone biosynthesis C-methylase UbiE [Chloroflexi bacterium]|nr:MAG: Ubiquinone/menaquinone biosynthesis C-methylase UbiE [Chloroflexota bacterium]